MPAWGRGGAGNIAQLEEAKKRMKEDLEANHTPELLSSDTSTTTATTTAGNMGGVMSSSSSAHHPPTLVTSSTPYAHMGRGGAGNWYHTDEAAAAAAAAAEIAATTLQAPSPITPSSAGSPATPGGSANWLQIELPSARLGRGGAGNFVWGATPQETEKGKQERERAEQLSAQVVADVEAGLQVPGRAFLGVSEEARGS